MFTRHQQDVNQQPMESSAGEDDTHAWVMADEGDDVLCGGRGREITQHLLVFIPSSAPVWEHRVQGMELRASDIS